MLFTTEMNVDAYNKVIETILYKNNPVVPCYETEKLHFLYWLKWMYRKETDILLKKLPGVIPPLLVY